MRVSTRPVSHDRSNPAAEPFRHRVYIHLAELTIGGAELLRPPIPCKPW